jgi:polar amino acid transport system substrate-binding protein
MRRVGILHALAALGVFVALVGGCGEESDDTPGGGAPAAEAAVTPPDAIASSGTLRFCTDPTYPPAEFLEGNQYAGFDIDIANAIAESMGVETAFVQTGFDGIVAAVRAGKCDAVIAAMNITPEREEAIDFVPYGQTGQGFMVAKGQGAGLETLEDLSGHTVAVQVGTTQRDAVDEVNDELEAAGRPPADVKTFPKDTDAAAALQAGRVDVYFADGPPIAYYVKRNPDNFEVAAMNLSSTPIGIGLAKDDAELRDAIQTAVDRLYENGDVATILEEWNVADVALADAR